MFILPGNCIKSVCQQTRLLSVFRQCLQVFVGGCISMQSMLWGRSTVPAAFHDYIPWGWLHFMRMITFYEDVLQYCNAEHVMRKEHSASCISWLHFMRMTKFHEDDYILWGCIAMQSMLGRSTVPAAFHDYISWGWLHFMRMIHYMRMYCNAEHVRKEHSASCISWLHFMRMTTFYEDALQYRGCYEEGAQCQLHFTITFHEDDYILWGCIAMQSMLGRSTVPAAFHDYISWLHFMSMITFYEDVLQCRACYEEGAQCQLHFMITFMITFHEDDYILWGCIAIPRMLWGRSTVPAAFHACTILFSYLFHCTSVHLSDRHHFQPIVAD